MADGSPMVRIGIMEQHSIFREFFSGIRNGNTEGSFQRACLTLHGRGDDIGFIRFGIAILVSRRHKTVLEGSATLAFSAVCPSISRYQT